ncbi:MAG TPA: peptidylprolyl isomerase [Holophagaceae bacterium]|nr:peptidylprolyl isomerase [Holophagaceae bacterium]
MRRILPLALLLSAALQAQAPVPPPAPAATPAPAASPAPSTKPRVKISTNYGPIVVELEPEAAPLTCANFLAYVKSGHYAGTIFHRVIDGFMIQGGGNTEDMKEKPTLAPVKNEAGRAFAAGLRNTRGTLAMARTTDPDSASAQFYINVASNESLDWKANTPEGAGYAVFGRVVSGLETVDKISKVKTSWSKGQASVPDYPVRIRSVEQLPQP